MRGSLFGTVALVLATYSVGEAQIAGRVTDTRLRPLHGIEVQFVVEDSVRSSAQTDSAGQFSLREATVAGSLRFRKFGYRPRSLRADPGKALEVILDEMPAELEEIKVVARLGQTNGKLHEFYAHRAQSKFGHFFDREDIEAKRPLHLSELMRAVPGARLLPGRFGSVVRLRGCRPLLWIDGVRLPGAELDEAVSMPDVEAVEVYPSFAGIPAQYIDRGTNCGAVVVWMKVS